MHERPILCSPTPLDTSPQPGTKKWIHVATAGKFDGYRGGKASFEFTRATFETVLMNFRSHPQYGKVPVVPWDYEHASEQALSLPSVAQHGAPATGWVHDLAIRDGRGGPELWALTEWTSSAAEQIRSGSYRWASVAISPRYIDPISGQDRGPALTSIALTNKPFLQGLEPIAASMNGISQGGASDQSSAAMRTISAINAQPGNNEIERADAYLCQNDPAHRALPRLQRIPLARQFVSDVCSMAGGTVRLSAGLADIDFEPKSPESRAALEEVARLQSPEIAGNVGLDYASRTLEAIAKLPGDDMILKAVRWLDQLTPGDEQKPLAERARVAAFYLKALKEAVGNGKL